MILLYNIESSASTELWRDIFMMLLNNIESSASTEVWMGT